MSDAPSLSDRYRDLIDHIIKITLKGEIRSKEQVYQMLLAGVSPGTGEVFERCLSDRLSAIQQQIETQTDELKQAKASRSLRALQTIQSEWERWQEKNQATAALDTAVNQLVESDDRLNTFLKITDPNQPKPFGLAQWQQLAKRLKSVDQLEVQLLAQGIVRGLESWSRLENHLVSWIYDQSQGQIGFASPGQQGPWMLWAKQVNSPVLQTLFQTLAIGQSSADWATKQRSLSLSDLVELVCVLRCLQQGLVNWFDKLIYDAKVGAKLSISTFLTFAVIWSQCAEGFQALPSVRNACFQVTLQILRLFAQREYFPLYGGIFASFTGEYLRDALGYLDDPLRQAEGTQEKARILTLLGYSTRALGHLDRASAFHQQALTIAQAAGDTSCEVANLNHLSRTCVAQTNYAEAINYSQRAIILSRQTGDRLGEANALANLGYSEVFRAQQLEQADPDMYEMAIDRLQHGLQLAEKWGDRQSQALCLSSLGVAEVVLERPQTAIAYLESGIQIAQYAGDLYLQGVNLTYLAEAHYRLQNFDKTIYAGCMAMYLLEQIASTNWRQPAGLLTVLRGQLGTDRFQELLAAQRAALIAAIGVDGYDHLPVLLDQYQQ